MPGRPVPLTKVLKVMDKVGQFTALIDFFASAHNGFGERARAAAEDADLADVAVLLLDEFQE